MKYKVTSVEEEKRNEYSVTFIAADNTTFELKIHEEVVVMFRLVVGKELEVDVFESMREKLDSGKAYQSAVALLSYRPYTAFDLTKKLISREFDELTVEDVVKRLKQSGLINDSNYAMMFVQQHINAQKKGPLLLQREMREKKIKDEYINTALDLYTESIQLETIEKIFNQQLKKNNKYGMLFLKQKIVQNLIVKGFDRSLIEQVSMHLEADESEEKELLEKELIKLLKKHSKLDSYAQKTKVIQALMRKGYAYDMVASSYEQALEEQENEY